MVEKIWQILKERDGELEEEGLERHQIEETVNGEFKEALQVVQLELMEMEATGATLEEIELRR